MKMAKSPCETAESPYGMGEAPIELRESPIWIEKRPIAVGTSYFRWGALRSRCGTSPSQLRGINIQIGAIPLPMGKSRNLSANIRIPTRRTPVQLRVSPC
jgi:hypothetical protein